jgi:hypothetical protein
MVAIAPVVVRLCLVFFAALATAAMRPTTIRGVALWFIAHICIVSAHRASFCFSPR